MTTAKILVVDDDTYNSKLMQLLLEAEGYSVALAQSGEEALKLVNEQAFDLILLDVMMGGMNGFEVAQHLKTNPATQAIPIIMITALDDPSSKLQALEMGAEEFLSKPVNRSELWVRVRNLLRLKEYNNFLANHNQILAAQVRERTEQLNASCHETIFIMTAVVEHKDEETGEHVRRISHYTATLAQCLGMGEEFADIIFHASPMHDVGKIGIPDHILLKAGAFLPQEWDVMKSHATLGWQMLKSGVSRYVKMGADIAYTHHERWDGSGYPRALKGDAIPLAGRLMSICDQYDALRSKRPYKPALTHAQAMNVLINGDGRTLPQHFDPQVRDVFIKNADTFADIYAQHSV